MIMAVDRIIRILQVDLCKHKLIINKIATFKTKNWFIYKMEMKLRVLNSASNNFYTTQIIIRLFSTINNYRTFKSKVY